MMKNMLNTLMMERGGEKRRLSAVLWASDGDAERWRCTNNHRVTISLYSQSSNQQGSLTTLIAQLKDAESINGMIY